MLAGNWGTPFYVKNFFFVKLKKELQIKDYNEKPLEVTDWWWLWAECEHVSICLAGLYDWNVG